jgi:hypothetical protein
MGIVSTAMLVLLSGCAMSPWVWSKPGITLTQGEKDMAECSEKANLLNVYGGKYDDGKFFVAGSVLGQDSDKPGIIFKNCMETKGYKRSKPGS